MYKIATHFDYNQNTPTPLISIVYSDDGSVDLLPLFAKGLKTKIKQVYDNIEKLKCLFKNETVIVNDAIAHMRFMELNPLNDHNIYDVGVFKIKKANNVNELLCKMITSYPSPKLWMKVRGDASVVYSYLEKRGVVCGYENFYPRYSLDTFSGRSKTTDFNIQGANEEYPIKHIDKHEYIVCFDWVAADIRMAGLISGEDNITSNIDPYEYLSSILSDVDFAISRNECKNEFLKNFYALRNDSPLMELFPKLKLWIDSKMREYEKGINYHTILGRPIPITNIRTTFNAIIQGSIAEAIQSVLSVVGRHKPECILTETHDSLIMSCNEDELKKMIKAISRVMNKPYYLINKNNFTMPVHIDIGTSWKKWVRYKTIDIWSDES